jgi:hypothetical protein
VSQAPAGWGTAVAIRECEISFTGSSATGAAITGSPVWNALPRARGGAAVVVCPMRTSSSRRAVSIGYVNAGQVCISVRRVLVDRAVVATSSSLLHSSKVRTGDRSTRERRGCLVSATRAASRGDPRRAAAGAPPVRQRGGTIIAGGRSGRGPGSPLAASCSGDRRRVDGCGDRRCDQTGERQPYGLGPASSPRRQRPAPRPHVDAGVVTSTGRRCGDRSHAVRWPQAAASARRDHAGRSRR